MKTYFSGTQKSSILGFWTFLGLPETIPKGGARSAGAFGIVSGAPGAFLTPTIDDFRVPEKHVS